MVGRTISYKDRTLLLYGEQGFGDVIQFARFIPQAIEQGGTVVIVVRPELVTLLQSQFDGAVTVISREDDPPDHDLVLPILSLPRVLGIKKADVSPAPYFRVADSSFQLPPRPAPDAKRIALAWAGSPTQKNDRNRSFSLMDMAPIFACAETAFYSVQKGPAESQINDSGLDYLITDLAPDLQNFADTSAVLSHMDLVISCDSAVVHLAGALGKPVWIALSVFHDWRYGISGDISPWYGSAEVFKQSQPGDWAGVFDRMADALSQ